MNEAKLMALVCERGRMAVERYVEGGRHSAIMLALEGMRDEAIEVDRMLSAPNGQNWMTAEERATALAQRFGAMMVRIGQVPAR